MSKQDPQNQGVTLKITNPERIVRLLARVAESGLPVQIRSLVQPDIAVKGRASNAYSVSSAEGFTIASISERGLSHLLSLSEHGYQIEFVLTNTKVVFVSRFLALNGQMLKVFLPENLSSMERRKDARYPMTLNHRAYIRMKDWYLDPKDVVNPPFLEYQRSFASWLAVGDVSIGGVSINSRFPGAYRVLPRGKTISNVELLLPLATPIPVAFEVRWTKRLKEAVQDLEGTTRTAKIFKFGLQFSEPTEQLQTELQKFMAKLAFAEAI